jgi:hypothetical protein
MYIRITRTPDHFLIRLEGQTPDRFTRDDPGALAAQAHVQALMGQGHMFRPEDLWTVDLLAPGPDLIDRLQQALITREER